MLTRDQVYSLLLCRSRSKNNIFSTLSNDMIRYISDFGQNPDSDIAIALTHAAYGREEDVNSLLRMLDQNPRLLLQAGNVKTPCGLEIRRVTIYEFLLGAGDHDLAKQVQFYFTKIPCGENQRLRQYERYRPHIEGVLTQKPYDLKPLFEKIKYASDEDVTAILNKDASHQSDLHNAIVQFRKDHAPQALIKPQMDYNHQTLLHALEMLYNEWVAELENLPSGDSIDKCDLIWRQVIGYLQRNLPAFDLLAFIRNLSNIVIFEDEDEDEKQERKNKPFIRKAEYTFKDHPPYNRYPFPDVSNDETNFSGLGFDYGINGFGFATDFASIDIIIGACSLFNLYIKQKVENYITYADMSTTDCFQDESTSKENLQIKKNSL